MPAQNPVRFNLFEENATELNVNLRKPSSQDPTFIFDAPIVCRKLLLACTNFVLLEPAGILTCDDEKTDNPQLQSHPSISCTLFFKTILQISSCRINSVLQFTSKNNAERCYGDDDRTPL